MKEISKAIGYRPTWAQVNLDNIAYNFAQIRNKFSPGLKIMSTVKADAYGHGLMPVAKRLAACGTDYFGVASIDEGIQLRRIGIKIPILVLGLILKGDIAPLFKYNLIPTVCTKELASVINKMAAQKGRPFKIHVKVDTGMGRIGVLQEDADKLIEGIHRMKFINIEGLFTHFAFADMNKKFTLYQIGLFNRLIAKLKKKGIHIRLIHAANSMGILGYKESHFNMVRPGLILYGLYPRPGLGVKLRPALSLKSRVVYLKRTPKGCGISYGHIYITKKETTVVTIPIGYGDGYPRNLSNKAPVLIRGRSFNISGRICMDQIMVDVGNMPVKLGDEVVLIGTQKKRSVSVERLAFLSGTIPYEIVCGLGSRVPRIYEG
ncbi:MAG: alanine racemase [Candidatus Omnitrophota bacterium]